MDSEQNNKLKLKDAIETAEDMLTSQIRALEILTNLLCSNDNDSDYEDYPDEDSCSEGSGDVDGMTMENLQTELTPELKENLISVGVFTLVLDKANYPAENVCQALAQNRAGNNFFAYHLSFLNSIQFCLYRQVIVVPLRKAPVLRVFVSQQFVHVVTRGGDGRQ